MSFLSKFVKDRPRFLGITIGPWLEACLARWRIRCLSTAELLDFVFHLGIDIDTVLLAFVAPHVQAIFESAFPLVLMSPFLFERLSFLCSLSPIVITDSTCALAFTAL